MVQHNVYRTQHTRIASKREYRDRGRSYALPLRPINIITSIEPHRSSVSDFVVTSLNFNIFILFDFFEYLCFENSYYLFVTYMVNIIRL